MDAIACFSPSSPFLQLSISNLNPAKANPGDLTARHTVSEDPTDREPTPEMLMAAGDSAADIPSVFSLLTQATPQWSLRPKMSESS